MNDNYVIKKSCQCCAKLRSSLCYEPDSCVQQGYKNFSQRKLWKKCRICGGPMRRIRTRPMSETTVVTDIVCADCGLAATETREYIEKKAPVS